MFHSIHQNRRNKIITCLGRKFMGSSRQKCISSVVLLICLSYTGDQNIMPFESENFIQCIKNRTGKAMQSISNILIPSSY